MSAASRSLRCNSHNLFRAIARSTRPSNTSITTHRVSALRTARTLPGRAFSISHRSCLPGLMPDTEHPVAPDNDEQAEQWTAANIEDEEYHKHADEFMNKLYERAEEVVEQRDDVEVEYSAGVLTISMPPNGEYVINKQPPNKQIWLSSPISGPKRFDWSIVGEGMDQKQGTATGEWIYLRDGTSFTEVIRKELGIDVSTSVDIEEQLAKKSTDPLE